MGERLADDVEEVVGRSDLLGLFIQLIKDFIDDPCQKVERSIVAADRIAVEMVTVKDGEAHINKGSPCITHQLFTVAVSDHEIDRLSEEEAAHVPQVFACPYVEAIFGR